MFTIAFDLTGEARLTGQASVPVGSRMEDDVRLHDSDSKIDCQSLAEQSCQGCWNCVDAFVLVGMDADQDGFSALADLGEQHLYRSGAGIVDQVVNEDCSGSGIAGFCARVFRVPLDDKLIGQQDDVWE